jgi:hypothetical protein
VFGCIASPIRCSSFQSRRGSWFWPSSTHAEVQASGDHAPNKSLQRSGGQWSLVCSSLAVLDKVPALGHCEPPAAELNR